MKPKIFSLVVGTSLVAASLCGYARPLERVSTYANASNPLSIEGEPQQASSQDQATNDQAPSEQSNDQPAQTSKSEQSDSNHDGGKDQTGTGAHGNSAKHAKKSGSGVTSQKQATRVSGRSPVQNAAEQILSSLDSAINIAQKSGSFGAAATSKQGDDIRARWDQLRQKAQTAKDDGAWTDVAVGGAGVLADTMKLIEASRVSAAPVGPDEQKNHARMLAADPRASTSQFSHLPMYLASLSLIVSVFALAVGWLLARREVNHALIDAGLL